MALHTMRRRARVVNDGGGERKTVNASDAEVCRLCGRAYVDLQCSDCGREFTMDASERAWHMAKFSMLPKRCPSCRAFVRAHRASTSSTNTNEHQLDDARDRGRR
jgi:putative zinc ribbon protein